MRRLLILGLAVLVFPASAQSPTLDLKIEQFMTPEEFQATGIAQLTAAQKEALNHWLDRYTLKVLAAAIKQQTIADNPSSVRTSCSPPIETTISGEIEGWDGDTIFKLDNGQIWQQAEYDYTYFYAYRPDVTIYQTSSGCRMKVEDESETVLVKRIR